MESKPVYDPKQIEPKWQLFWEQHHTYNTPDEGEKVYVLGMFPYPSGDGLHVGHVRIYTGTDVLSRFFRMQGKRVLHPMGWDAFGLPTENAAIKAKINPKILAKRNIDNFRRQMNMIGFGYDWSREFATTDPTYYRWTQWLFLQLYSLKNAKGERLIYRKQVPTNWCDFCKTILANEEVLPDGTHERCGKPVVQRLTEQWLMRITDYADRLLEDLKNLDWPNGILEMQRNWIGKSKGLVINFQTEETHETIPVWTKYWETVYGTTFLVLAPEHPFIADLLNAKRKTQNTKLQLKSSGKAGSRSAGQNLNLDVIQKYVIGVLGKTEEQRKIGEKDKQGVFTGAYAINPVNNQKIPIWVADYVLSSVGTGAVMGVPAHDVRDFEFAKKHGLGIVQVVSYQDKQIDAKVKSGEMAFEGEGILVSSGQFDGQDAWGEGKKQIAQWMIERGWAKWQTTYHLRDWIFSRQHYWGEPIPLVYCEKCGDENGVVPVPDEQLPVELPDVEHYEPTTTGKSPLSNVKDWVETTCPSCGGPAKRETDTMPNWAGSCWYFLRFTDPHNNSQPFSADSLKTWMPVDWYLGGAEHAVLHLLYSRFWVKALQDKGLLAVNEPFARLRSVGLVLGEGNVKMSKSLGNVVNPDEIVAIYGADTLRIYELFMGPWNQSIGWSMKGVAGAWRFLERVQRLIFQTDGKIGQTTSADLAPKLHQLIKKITTDIPAIKFNTSVAALMKFVNAWEADGISLSAADAGIFARLLAPLAPHLAEEIWAHLGNKASVHTAAWPEFNDSLTQEKLVEIPVQVNGKTRGLVTVESGQEGKKSVVESAAKIHPNIEKYLTGSPKVRTVFVPGRTINFVTGE